MDNVFKINNLSFNNSKTQFCLSFNNGIKNYRTDNFELLNSSNLLGNISQASLVYELNQAIYISSENDEESKKLYIYDLSKKKVIYSTTFSNKIKSIKTADKYLIIGFEKELQLFSLEDIENISAPIGKIEKSYENYEIWGKKIKEKMRLYVIYSFEEFIYCCAFDGIVFEEKFKMKSPAAKIQNFFYIKKLCQVFMPDENAKYIYSIYPETKENEKNWQGEKKDQGLCLYRGKTPGYISSITLINNTYLAVNNLNRTIHIYDLKDKNENKSLGQMVGYFIYGDYVKSVMKIRYSNLVEKNEGILYDDDFQKKGALLLSEDDGVELKVIAYNGYAYNIEINFLKKEIESIKKKEFCTYKIENMSEENPKNTKTDTSDNFVFIFDKQPKKK